jgi:C4-dicarboxylate-specific signal transduction histidine kinase
MFRKDDHERREIDVNGLIRETITLVHGEIESQQAVLKMDLLESSPTIVGENVPLQQVLINLIINALDAMSTVKDREHVLSVKSHTNERGDVLISVADSGTGIAPENAGRVFEPFFTTKSHGLGMGLSICRSIVEAHSGRLLASSALPHGCIFHIHLPSGPSQ